MGPCALIDLAALRHNLQQARNAAPHSRVIAVIKADAYGHGMLRAARALASADAFAVARVEEGVALRRAGIEKPLLVLGGFFDADELRSAAEHSLQLAINQWRQLQQLEQVQIPRPVECWLKIDSGMHRLGFPVEAAADAFRRLQKCRGVAPPLRLMTHFANADDLGDDSSKRQLQAFLPLAAELGAETSIANSAATLGWPDARGDWIRPGIMLYGSSPFLNGRAKEHDLRPVMTLQSRLMAVNHHPKGAPVGYGATWRCPEAMPVGVVAIGYADGYPRHAPSGTPVLVNGGRVPLAGRVSMDMICVDLRSQPQAKVGDPAVLWGRGLPAEEIAEAAGTISYELFCGVGTRVAFTEQES